MDERPHEAPVRYPISPAELRAIKERLHGMPEPAEKLPSTEPLPHPPTELDQTPSSQSQSLAASTVTAGFEGPSYTPSYWWYPPDPSIAAGPSNLVTAVNGHVTVYSKTGTQLLRKELWSWFSTTGTTRDTTYVVDPWAIYDPGSSRFFLVSTETGGENVLYIAVSKTSDALGSWCEYKFDYGELFSAAVPGLKEMIADYPKIGTSKNGLYITANMYNGTFQYAAIFAWLKSDLTSCKSVNYLTGYYNLANLDGTRAFTIQPSVNLDNTEDGYFVNAHVPFTSYPDGTALTPWSIHHLTSSQPGVIVVPTLYAALVPQPVQSYFAPPDAKQEGSSDLIDTLDGRILNAVYAKGVLWATQTTKTEGGRSSIRIYKITPTVGDPYSYSVSLKKEYFDRHLKYFYYNPSVIADVFGNAAVVFNRSSHSTYAEIYHAHMLSGPGEAKYP
jgi:hypothetical protein